MAADTPTHSSRMSIGDETGPVTAARRNHNLETIRKQPGWEDFPDCLPPAMRTTKGGKTTDFGNTKLRIIERIAINASFIDALAYFMVLTQDGSRILRLKDLESCADNFDKSGKSRPSRRTSDGRDSLESVEGAEEEVSPQRRDSGGELSPKPLTTPDRTSERRSHRIAKVPTYQLTPPAFPVTPVKQTKAQVRSHDEMSTDTMDTLPIHPGKRQRTGQGQGQALDFVIQPPVPSILVLSPNGRSGPQAVDLGNEFTGDLPPPSPMRRVSIGGSPSRVSSTDANVVFPAIDRAFDKLLAKARSQQRLVCTVLEHRREINARMASKPPSFSDLETDLASAKNTESKARLDVEQARAALDAMEAQYSGVDSSLSRALLATVTTELEKAQDAVKAAASEKEGIESVLAQAQVREEGLPQAKEEVEFSVVQLQNHTGYWLKRLGEVGVEFANQMNALQTA